MSARRAWPAVVALASLPVAVAGGAAAPDSPAAPTSTAAPAPVPAAAQAPSGGDPLADPTPLGEARIRAMSADMLRGLDGLDAALAQRAANRDKNFPAELPGRDTLLALEEQVLAAGRTGPVREQLAAVQKALDGGDAASADTLLRQAAWSLTRMRQRIQVLGSYPARISRIDTQAETLGALLEANAVQTPHGAAINRLEAALSERERRREFEAVLANELPELERLYRVALDDAFNTATQAALARPADAFESKQRTAPCPKPVPGKPGVGKPSIDPAQSAPTDDFYPANAARQGFEGRVVIRATVSAEGCARSAQVLVSTGDAEVDAAAARWTLEGAVFHPAIVEGRAAAASAVFNVRFRLSN
jgi:TonB family protein